MRGKRIKPLLWGGILAGVLTAALFLGWGSGGGSVQEVQRPLMGTLFKVKAYGEGLSPERFGTASEAAFAEVARIEQVMSEWRPDSPVSRAARLAGREAVPVSEELLGLIDRALQISRMTGGVFDISFKPLGRLWRVEEGRGPPDPEAVRQAQRLVDYRQILLDRTRGTLFLKRSGMAIGLGAIAKGYAAGRAAQVMAGRGIPNVVIDAGGDLYVTGRKGRDPWTCGVRDPRGGAEPLLVLRIKQDCAVVTSGDYERYFEYQGKRYHHIIDPRTGAPAEGTRSVTVLARDPADADALATAFFILGPETSRRIVEKVPGVAFLLVDRAGTIWRGGPLSQFAEEVSSPSHP